MKVFYVKRILLCVLLCTLFLLSTSAATWEEMQENGAVSDGGIRLGDARDGIVSDVSDPNEDSILGDIITDASDALGDLVGGGSSAPETTGSMAPEPSTERTTVPTTGAATDAGEGGGMTMGVIIAILVVIAVIVVIFLLLPKRK